MLVVSYVQKLIFIHYYWQSSYIRDNITVEFKSTVSYKVNSEDVEKCMEYVNYKGLFLITITCVRYTI